MPKRYWYIILTYIITQLSSYPAALIAISYFKDNYTEVVIYWSIFSFILALVITLLLLRPDMQLSTNQREGSRVGTIIIWSIVGFFMAYFAQIFATLFELKVLGIEVGSKNTANIMGISRAIPLFMIIPAIIAPILEEVIFRKIIFGSLYKRMNFFFAAALSALVFGAIHGELQHILVYSSMGFVFAYLYVKTKSILTPIIVHAALNTMTVIAQYSLSPEEIQKQLDQLNTILFFF